MKEKKAEIETKELENSPLELKTLEKAKKTRRKDGKAAIDTERLQLKIFYRRSI
tara:strand:+ start:799 stop:960 length:162 start_codon:yes stop_codon:yes gene_type:complete